MYQDNLGMNILRRQQIEKKKKKAENETKTRLEGLKGEHNQKLWLAQERLKQIQKEREHRAQQLTQKWESLNSGSTAKMISQEQITLKKELHEARLATQNLHLTRRRRMQSQHKEILVHDIL